MGPILQTGIANFFVCCLANRERVHSIPKFNAIFTRITMKKKVLFVVQSAILIDETFDRFISLSGSNLRVRNRNEKKTDLCKVQLAE